MKMKEYSKLIAELAEKYPDYEVVYSKDDEGNRFQKVKYIPVAGAYDEDEKTFDTGEEFNAVCVN